jgi:hypothetical protein
MGKPHEVEIATGFALDMWAHDFGVERLRSPHSAETDDSLRRRVADVIIVRSMEQHPRVWVVMQNDFPAAVFSSKIGAMCYVEHHKAKMVPRVHWHVHDFYLDPIREDAA